MDNKQQQTMDNSASTRNDVYSVEEAMLLDVEEAMLLDSDDDELRYGGGDYDDDDDSEYICCNDFDDDEEEEDEVLGAHPTPVTPVTTVTRSVTRSVTPVPTIADRPRTRQKRDDVVDTEIPRKVSREEAVRMVRKKLGVEKAIRPDYVSDEEKSNIEKVAVFCEMFVSRNFDDTNWDPKTLVDDSAGLYGIEYLLSSRKSKVGMSRYRDARTKRQMKRMLKEKGIRCLAYSLYNMDAIRNFVTEEDVLHLKKLRLPGLCFHPDKHENLDDLIRCQLAEMAVACCFDCSTSVVGERLLQVPSQRIRKMFNDRKPIATLPIRHFFSKLDRVFSIYSWPTIQSYLLSLSDPYYDRKLREAPQDEFITNHLNKMLWGDLLVGWEDSVKKSPRAKEIEGIVQQLKDLVFSDETTAANAPAIVAIIQTIDRSSDNHNSYYPPSNEDMAKGARSIFEKRMKSDHSIYMTIERSVWKALLEVEREWCRVFFRLDASIRVEDTLTLVECTSGHRVVVTPSYFKAMGETRTFAIRMRATHHLCTTKRLLGELGLVSKSNVGDFRRRFTSFAMSLEGVVKNGQGSYREARISHLPKSYCLGSPRNILSVSQNIGAGIGCCETLLLYRLLGESRFNRMMSVFGIQTPTPLDLEFRCPGLPSVGKYQALECRAVPDESGNLPYIHMVGADTPGHPYRGCFACGACIDGYRVRARAKSQKMIDDGEEVTEDEQRFHSKSMASKVRHATTVKESMKRRMETNPEETMTSIRKKQRRSNTKQALQMRTLPKQPAKKSAAKKKNGTKRRDPSKAKHYHPRFKKLLESTFGVLARTFGEEAMSSYCLNDAHALLVEKEVAAGRTIGDFELKRFGKNKDPIIIAVEFDEIAKQKFRKEPGIKSKLWIIREEHLPSPEDRLAAFDERSRMDRKEYTESVVSKACREENRGSTE